MKESSDCGQLEISKINETHNNNQLKQFFLRLTQQLFELEPKTQFLIVREKKIFYYCVRLASFKSEPQKFPKKNYAVCFHPYE